MLSSWVKVQSFPSERHSILGDGIMQRILLAAFLLLVSCSVFSASPGCSLSASRCDFVCDCWDCSDERHCGYHRVSAVHAFSCDFEQDDCGWEDVSPSSYRWARERLSSPMWGSRPHTDHTLRNRWGWFMATGSHGSKSAATATVRSPALRNAAATCEIHIHYHMGSANSSGDLRVSAQLKDTSQTIVLWEMHPKPVAAWRRAVIYTGRIPGEFQVTVTSALVPPALGHVVIDDLEFRHCALSAPQSSCHAGQYQCARGSCIAGKARCDGTDDCGDKSDEEQCEGFDFCDFETGLCLWSGWERVSGLDQKPSRDHTTNSRTGHFLRARPGQGLTGPFIKPTDSTSCTLVLYYVMDGSNSSRLTIGYNDTAGTQVLEIVGQRGNVWLRESVTFPAVSEAEQILIQVHDADAPDAVVALDDLVLSAGCNMPGNSSVNFTMNIQGPVSARTSARVSTKDACCSGSFTFDAGMDGWTDVSLGTQKWMNELQSFPDESHTGLLMVTSSEGNLLTHAEVHSPPLCAACPSYAMNMTYCFNSGPAGSFSIRLWDPASDTHRHVWNAQERSESWRSAVIPLGEKLQPFQLVFSASLDPPPGGVWKAAIDEIQFLECSCSSEADTVPVTCNFDSGLCGWYQDQTDDIDWELRAPSDHTTGAGNFLHVAGESRLDRGMKARLISYPQSRDANPQCLSLYYRVWGPDAGSLNLYVKFEGEEEALLWSSTGTHGNRWHRQSVPIPESTKSKYQLFLDAVRDGSVGHISVDDITLTLGACITPTRCTFEAGLCGFTAEGTYKWKIQQGANARPHTGPFMDHTLQTLTGHYAVVDTSAGALPEKKTATLTSGSHGAQPEVGCLSFWYLPGSSNPGTLNVVLVEKKTTRLLSISGTHQGGWRYQSVALRADTEWTVKFEAVGAGGDQSFIALDDIHISHHQCHQQASCDFESGPCTWTNVRIPLMDTYDWDWSSGAALTAESDHTLGTAEGHYAFVDTGAMHADGSTAWLSSEQLPPTDGSCFAFWFRTDSPHHNHMGELVLFIMSSHGLQPVWLLHGYHSGAWQHEQLQINSTVEFQIVFEASKGTRPHSATIFLDDVTYTVNVPCTARAQETKKNDTGTILAIVIGVLLILVCIAAAYMFYQKWMKHQERAQRTAGDSPAIGGFDHVIFAEATDTSSDQ